MYYLRTVAHIGLMSIPHLRGKELRPGQVETIQSTSKSLTIRGASISDSAVDTGTMQDSSAPAQLLLTLKTGSERYLDFPICTFIPGKVSCFVNLVFQYIGAHTPCVSGRVRSSANHDSSEGAGQNRGARTSVSNPSYCIIV